VDSGLRAYVLRRLGFAALMLVGVSIILFVLMGVPLMEVRQQEQSPT